MRSGADWHPRKDRLEELPPDRLDTVGISWECHSTRPRKGTERVQARVSNHGSADERWSWSRKLDGGGFVSWGIAGRCWAEASLPKRAGVDNIEGVSVAAGKELLAGLFEEASAVVAPDRTATVGTAKVVRLDPVRDFDGVKSQRELFDGLALVEVDKRFKTRRFLDGERGKAETLKRGPAKAWETYLYDKHAETLGVAAAGRTRFEARLRPDILTSVWAKGVAGHIASVHDLSAAKVQLLTATLFERVGFNREVAAVGRVVADVMAYEGLSPRERMTCLGYLMAGPMGYSGDLSDNTRRKYRRVADALGITLASDWSEATFTVALDYLAGTETLRVAA